MLRQGVGTITRPVGSLIVTKGAVMRFRLGSVMVAMALLGSACSSDPAVITSTTTTVAPTTTTTTTTLAEPVTPWPTDGWQTSTPEAQGMRSGDLATMVESITATGLDVDSVAVVRHGHLVLDAVFYPFPDDRAHIIHSCTKSIVSTLIGIAIDRGLIESVATPVVEILADAAPTEGDVLKDAMTVEDLLMMASGLDCRDSYLYQWAGLREMRRSDDWAAFMLALPMSEPPGTDFEYCNGASFLLSAILTEVTGGPALDFAQEYLFDPLGITDVTWLSGPGGINHGWGDMFLRPTDMAKIGYLFLHEGEWDGRQVVSSAWVEAATAAQIDAGTLAQDYGYQWWIDEGGYVMALGFGGQYIIVDTEHDLVVTFTSGLGAGFDQPERLYLRQIVGAVVGEESLPADPEGVERLAAAVAEAGRVPEAVAAEPHPMEATVDGVTYWLEDNAGGFAWLRLGFEDGVMVMAMEDVDGPIEVTVPQDGLFHESEAWGRAWAWRPVWEDSDTLSVEFQVIGGVGRGEFRFSFDGAFIHFRYHELVLGTDVRATGEAE